MYYYLFLQAVGLMSNIVMILSNFIKIMSFCIASDTHTNRLNLATTDIHKDL